MISGPSDDILQRLRVGTADLHEQVEQSVDIFHPDFSLPDYIDLIRRMYGFWSPLEERLCSIRELAAPELRLEDRLKAHLLEDDLGTFGVEPASVPKCQRLPSLTTFERALGCMYVLEGSTLGSQLIGRHVRQRFGIGAGAGASFYNVYEGAVGARWKEFRAFVLSRARPEASAEIVSAARATFETLALWLSGERQGRAQQVQHEHRLGAVVHPGPAE